MGITPLHLAASHGYIKCVEILLNKGIDINGKDNDGDTALHRAARWGNVDIIEVLKLIMILVSILLMKMKKKMKMKMDILLSTKIVDL